MRTLTSSVTLLGPLVVAFALYTGCSSDGTTGSGTGTDAGGTGNEGGGGTEGGATTDSGSTTTDASTTTDSGATGAKNFGETCSAGAECKSGVCFMGGSQSFCSLKCTSPADCPMPPTSGQCNNQGYCKK